MYNIDIYLVTQIEHTHTKILVSAFERQVSWDDTNNAVISSLV